MKTYKKIYLVALLLLVTSYAFAGGLPTGKLVSHSVYKIRKPGTTMPIAVCVNIYTAGPSGNSNQYYSENYQIVTFLTEDESDNINNRVTLPSNYSFTMTASATASNYINPQTGGTEILGTFPFSATIYGGTSYSSQTVEGPSAAGGNSIWLSFSNITLTPNELDGIQVQAYQNAFTWYGPSPVPQN